MTNADCYITEYLCYFDIFRFGI